MGHKHSSLHSQLKNQSDGPNCDLVGSSNSTNPNNNFDTFINIKHGPFRRKLSMRNISIRRSFHISGSKHNRNNNHKQLNDYTIQPTTSNNRIGLSATTDQLPSTSSSLNNNNNHIHNYHQTPVLPRSNTGKRSHNKNREKSIVMDRLRKSFRNSFRKKKSSDIITESQKPHQWQSDEQSVRSGNCVFPIKYLGCVEVYESRGMQICEDALRRLRNSRRRPIKGQLYVTGDGIRVVDDDTKGLIVDQTIEKVSFCAPDRSHERGFSYICRDGTTRRWMCHGFHATKDSGERLSHAVGCAFNICLERKQKRDKESVSAIIDSNHFTRTGSFRQSTITERLQDPQVAKPSEPVPLKQPVHNPYAVARPHATASLLQRQGSLRGGPLNASPFKRQLSLRINSSLINDTSSLTSSPINSHKSNDNNNTVNDNNILHIINENNDNIPARNRAQSLDLAATFEEPLIEMNSNKQLSSASSVTPNKETSSTNNDDLSSTMIAAMCQQLSHDLNMLSLKNDVENSSNDRTKMQLAAKRNDSNNNNNNKLIGTGLPHLVKDKNSLFTFSNIDQWVSNKTTSSTSTTATTTTTLSSNEVNLSQQLNTGSIDSGIATSSGSSLNGSIKVAINSKASTLPPAVVDRMPDVCAPPPPPISSATSSPSPSQSSVFCPSIQSSSAVPMTTSSYNSNTNNKVNGAKNPFLISDISENLMNDDITSTTVNEFKSTNPFIDLSQTKKSSINDDSLNDNFSTDVSTILTSIAAPVTAATMTTTAAAASSSLLLSSSSSSSITTNTNYSNNNKNNNDNNISSQMIKAFEVSM